MCYLIAEVTTKKRMEKKGFLLEVRTCRCTHSQDRIIPREHGLPFMVSFIQLFILQTFTEYAAWAKTCGGYHSEQDRPGPFSSRVTGMARETDNE